jgi:hypothetical protein
VNLNAFNSTAGCVVANLELTFDILAALKQKVVFYMHHYPPVLTIYCHHFESVAKWLVLSISLESAHFKEQFEGANVKKSLDLTLMVNLITS